MTNETFTFTLATEFNFPNISIYRKTRDSDNVQTGWRVNVNAGYVFYDITDNEFEYQEDPITGEFIEVPVTYYYTIAYLPLNYNFDRFQFIAVPRDSVDENYIFGVPGNDHEIA